MTLRQEAIKLAKQANQDYAFIEHLRKCSFKDLQLRVQALRYLVD